MIDEDDEMEMLRRINIELMEEIEELRNKIEALEELAINTKMGYNDGMLWDRKAWEE
jgi:hypothetical protein